MNMQRENRWNSKEILPKKRAFFSALLVVYLLLFISGITPANGVQAQTNAPALSLTANCTPDSLGTFTITNIGSSMTGPGTYTLLLNGTPIATNSFQLNAGGSTTISTSGLFGTMELQASGGGSIGTVSATTFCQSPTATPTPAPPAFSISANCTPDSQGTFTITNIGSSMTGPGTYTLLLNGTPIATNSFQLNAGGSTTISTSGLFGTMELQASGGGSIGTVSATTFCQSPTARPTLTPTALPAFSISANCTPNAQGTFTISNIGTSMSAPGSWTLDLNGTPIATQSFQLNGGASTSINTSGIYGTLQLFASGGGSLGTASASTFCQSPTPTGTLTTNTPSTTPTNTSTPNPTNTPTSTNTMTVTNTMTSTNTPTTTVTLTSTNTQTATATLADTKTFTPTSTDTKIVSNQPTNTPTPSQTYLHQPSKTPTPTQTRIVSNQPTNTPTPTKTYSQWPFNSPTPSKTFSYWPYHSPTPSKTFSYWPYHSATPSKTFSFWPFNSPTPTKTYSNWPVHSPTPTLTRNVSQLPSSTSTKTKSFENESTERWNDGHKNEWQRTPTITVQVHTEPTKTPRYDVIKPTDDSPSSNSFMAYILSFLGITLSMSLFAPIIKM